MTGEGDWTAVHLKDGVALRGWDTARSDDERATAAAQLAHAIDFGRAQEALETVADGGSGLTAAHGRALHFANEMAELHHYAPLVAVDDGVPVLAPGVAELVSSFARLGLWQGRPPWHPAIAARRFVD